MADGMTVLRIMVAAPSFGVSSLEDVAEVDGLEYGMGLGSGIKVRSLESGEGLGSLDVGVGGLEAGCSNQVQRSDCLPLSVCVPDKDASS